MYKKWQYINGVINGKTPQGWEERKKKEKKKRKGKSIVEANLTRGVSNSVEVNCSKDLTSRCVISFHHHQKTNEPLGCSRTCRRRQGWRRCRQRERRVGILFALAVEKAKGCSRDRNRTFCSAEKNNNGLCFSTAATYFRPWQDTRGGGICRRRCRCCGRPATTTSAAAVAAE